MQVLLIFPSSLVSFAFSKIFFHQQQNEENPVSVENNKSVGVLSFCVCVGRENFITFKRSETDKNKKFLFGFN